jgi:hypothetical protein
MQVVAPVSFEAHCPRFLRDIIDIAGISWFVRDTQVSIRPCRFVGRQSGADLSALITSENRSLPLVVVSDFEGLVLHPGVAEGMARDLAGLGIVATVNETASWAVTGVLGAEWSCFNGAIRIYWPFAAVGRDPLRHPVWTSRRLLNGLTTEEAAQRIRNQFRRKILGLSALTIRRHPIFEEIERGHRLHAAEARRREATNQAELLELYENQNVELDSECRSLKDKVASLEIDLANARAMRAWSTASADEEILPDADVPPSSVLEAVKRARSQYSHLVVFGNDVTDGARNLADNAGPPDKVLAYLAVLAELAEALRKGGLGKTIVQWLKDRGLHVSGESESIKNSRAEMRQRTWHDGRERREFELHLKPTDGTSPDRCVRIYFDWDEEQKKVVVGWLGRKPGT